MTARLILPLMILAWGALPARAAAPLVAGYWGNFQQFWVGAVQRQNGVILALVGFGIVCIFIVTRSKAKK